MSDLRSLLTTAMDDARHAWSVGVFGAIGEYMRDADEPTARRRDGPAEAIYTDRAALRVTPRDDVRVIAYDTLGSDGETWGQSVAFCMEKPADGAPGVVCALGPDKDAILPQDTNAMLFDLGVGKGHVRMCLRTRDAELIAALNAIVGKPLFGAEGVTVMPLVLKAQPHRVMLSPLARVEVFAPIPMPGGDSPEGPHTHLLPKLLASGRTHAANAPIPEGWQPVLMLHPRSPWRDAMGRRTEFDQSLDALFEELLAVHALPEDREVRAATVAAVEAGADPKSFNPPATRRGRTQMRITLRRLARTRGAERVAAWRSVYDRVPAEDAEPDEEAALHG